MKTKTWLFSMLSCIAVSSVSAQNIPSHDAYVKLYDDNVSQNFYDYFRTWEPGQALSEDENFFISRVPLKKRFENANTQVDPTLTTDRKFCMWTPMGVADTYWQSLPRYVFDGDNFSMWSYVDSQGGWSLPWIRVPGAYSDVTHRNGVANSGGLIFFDSWGGDNTNANNCVRMLTEKENGKFKYAEKLVKFMRYYGVDGLGVNPEGSVPNASDFQDFIIECRKIAKDLNWQFHIYWYGTSSNNGNMDLGSSFIASKQDWLWKNGSQVTDMYMLNYSWSSGASSSVNLAKSIGSDPFTLYAGYDIQGNWLGRGSWSVLKNTDMSIAFWGNHTTNMIYQNSSEFGSGDEAVQYCYLDKQEQVFSGGLRNPANRPAIKDGITSASEAAMEKFHGIAEYLPARSVLQELPFVTRFGLGNGKVFRNEGKVTFNNKWFNIGVQDYLPTWRWWITDANGDVPSDAIDCGFTFEDSWYAGSALKLSGATKVSNIRLFKTNFNIAKGDKISMRYKVNNGTESHLKLIWSKVGSESDFQSADIPDAVAKGEWMEFSKTANALGMTGNVACIGLAVENTSADYELLVGEFAIVNNNVTPHPVTPTIITDESKILKKRTYNALDFKFSWKCADTNPSDPSLPIYNEDVDTWYFEVYSQAKGEEPILCGTTSSWAHYVVGAPVSSDNTISEYRVGVRAVAPDGKTTSDIAWTNYLNIPVTMIDGIECNKAVIKAGEEFTVSLLDPNQAEPMFWELINSTTGENKGTFDMGRSFTTSLSEEGYYDVKITKQDLSELTYRGYVQVSPAVTGALPLIDDITASKTEVDLSQSDDPVTLTFTGRKGEGTVSRGLKIDDPYMFRIPSEFLPNNQGTYSIGFWLKPDKFSHAQYGTNLLNQRDISLHWPNNNWGAFWVHIWPKTTNKNNPDEVLIEDNIVSFTMYNNESTISFNGNNNKHEIPNLNCCTDGTYFKEESYSLTPGQWTHIMIMFNGSQQSIYFNGKKVGSCAARKNSYNESPIYFGGSNVYHSGFTGVIDDVQIWHKALSDSEVVEAMGGYEDKEIPAGLQGYWTFESDTYNEGDKTFENKGLLAANTKASYIEFKGSAGENTSLTTEIVIPASINVEGNPALSGSMPITTTATYEVENAKVTNNGDDATVAFDTDGTYDVTLTLQNGWGTATMTKQQYIVVVGGAMGVDENNVVESLSVYPNPFIENINLQFAVDGNYQVDVFDAQGRQVASKKYQARAGEICTMTMDNAAKGIYSVVISQDGKRVKALKLVK